MITITATFPSEEYIDILATRKGYQDTIMTPREKEESFDAYTGLDGVEVPAGTRTVQVMEELPNPQSKEDFIRQVYDGIVKNDISTEVIRYNNRQKEGAQIAEENTIREAVAGFVTSTVK